LGVGARLAGLLALAASLPASAADQTAGYEVVASEGAQELRVEARFPSGVGENFALADGLSPFLRDVEAEADGEWRALPRTEAGFTAPACTKKPCHIRYRFLLAEAARKRRSADTALEHRGVFVAPPSSWLLRPAEEDTRLACRFRVRTPENISFVTGVFPSPGSGDEYELGADDLESPPAAAFGPLRTERIEVAGGVLLVAVSPGELSLPRAALRDWVANAARAVAGFYGRFPVPRALVLVLLGGGSRIGQGVTMGNGGASIRLRVGQAAGADDLAADWMLTHEMVHLALPNLDPAYRWLEEGVATYVEPIARARVGALAPEQVWRGFVAGMPDGLPRAGDRGLDRAYTWGRTYWGGALFCLLADVAIRERTQERRSLDDALRAILDAGGSIATRWDLGRTLETADRAVGAPVLAELHARLGSRGETTDLDRLWKRLGVLPHDGALTFDDQAPLAAVRRAIAGPTPRP
jgi:hypothetical protein